MSSTGLTQRSKIPGSGSALNLSANGFVEFEICGFQPGANCSGAAIEFRLDRVSRELRLRFAVWEIRVKAVKCFQTPAQLIRLDERKDHCPIARRGAEVHRSNVVNSVYLAVQDYPRFHFRV